MYGISFMQLPMLDWTHKQRYARKGIRYRGILRVKQISNHGPAKTQAEITKPYNPCLTWKKWRKTEMMMNDEYNLERNPNLNPNPNACLIRFLTRVWYSP